MMEDMRSRLWLMIGAVVVAACSSSAQSPRQMAPNEIVATVGSTSITLAQVDDKALQQSTASFGSVKLSQALYEARRAALDDLVRSTRRPQLARHRARLRRGEAALSARTAPRRRRRGRRRAKPLRQ